MFLNKLKADKNLEFSPIDSADFLIFKRVSNAYDMVEFFP